MKIYRYYGIELDRSQIINYTNVAENELQHSLHVTFKFGLDTDEFFIDGTFCVFDENNDAHQSL